MPKTKPIRYAQIGAGHAHANKIQVYRESPDYEVVGVVEPNVELRRKAERSETYKDLAWLGLDEMLQRNDIQVVGIETEVDGLLKHAQLAIDADKHIHLDKPAGASLAPFRKVLDDAMRKHLAVQLGYMYRYNPAILLLKDLLAKGHLGQPFELHCVMSKKIGDASRPGLAKYAGGSMFELGCHLIDLVVGLLGTPDKVHSFLRASRSEVLEEKDTPRDTLQDNTLALFEYPQATATIRTTLIEVDGFARRHLVLCGTEGTMHIQPLDRPKAKLTLSRAVGKHQRGAQELTFSGYQRYVLDAAELAKVVRHEQDPSYSYEHDYQVQKALLEASGMDA